MIVARLMGGLGNQMFQYATCKAVALKNNTCLKLDISLLADEYYTDPHERKESYELGIFCIDELFATTADIERFHPTYPDVIAKIAGRIKRSVLRPRVYIHKQRGFDSEVLNLPDDYCIIGAWQSEKYFLPIEDLIRTEFRFKDPISLEDEAIAAEIDRVQSIALHVRRGDYVEHPIYSQSLGAKTDEYYNSALNIMREKVPDGVVYVFSDDIEWCRNRLQTPLAVHYVSGTNQTASTARDLQLMTKCKHFIISNSTYSWWAAWLANSPHKIVIGPEVWTLDGSIKSDDILPKTWLKI